MMGFTTRASTSTALLLLLAACPTPTDEIVPPTAPGSPRAVAGNASVTLTWEPSQGADRYDVVFSGSSGAFSADDVIENVSSPFVHIGLINNVRMFYEVRAVNVAGTVSSVEVSATPNIAATAPRAPRNVSATGGDGRVTLEWDAHPDALYYTVYRGNGPGVTTATGFPTVNADNPFVDGNSITNGRTYHYMVIATYDDGDSPMSAEVFATPDAEGGGDDVPSAPLDVVAIGGDGQVALAWSASAGATRYNVYGSDSAGVSTTATPVTTTTTTSAVDTGLPNGIARHYLITAENDEGESAGSAEVTATPSMSTTTPSLDPPLNLTATAGADHVTLQWTPVTGATHYTLYFSTTVAPTPQTGTPIVGVTSPFVHQGGLLAGTTYSYVVTASNADGESAASNVASAIVGGVNPTSFANVSSTVTGGVLDINFKNLTTDESMPADGVLDSALIVRVKNAQGQLVTGHTVQVAGGITGAIPEVMGTGQHQTFVEGHLVPATFTFTVSGAQVNGSSEVELLTMPTCQVTAPTSGATLPVGQDIEATWTGNSHEYVGVYVEDAAGSVSYAPNGQDPNVDPWFVPDPGGVILPGTDFTTAGPWSLRITAGWHVVAGTSTAEVRGLHTCKVDAVLQ